MVSEIQVVARKAPPEGGPVRLECFEEAEQDRERDLADPALDPGEVGGVDAGAFRQHLLGPPAAGAEVTNGLAEVSAQG